MKSVRRHPQSDNRGSKQTLMPTSQNSRPNIDRNPPGVAAHQGNQDQHLDHGKAPGLDKRTQLRLRRGQVRIESRLDLHGMTKDAAHDALSRFLERAYMTGKKTVLVVTGKGLRADGRVGVLREAVPKWLNAPSARQWVHAFDHASPRDGGEGALYIILRRRR